MRVERVESGWMVEHDRGYVHLTADWADALHRDQFQIHGTQNPALNRLRYELRYGDPTVEQVEEWFAEAYAAVVRNRQDRKNLGLKAVTRHGHEDLEAVRNGEPVKPWNAAQPAANQALEDFVRRMTQ